MGLGAKCKKQVGHLLVLRSTTKGTPFTAPSMRTLAVLAPSLTTSAAVRPREEPPCNLMSAYFCALCVMTG